MANQRTLLPLVLAAVGAYALIFSLSDAFIAAQARSVRSSSVALRAETETETGTSAPPGKMPKPDFRILNDQSKVGATYDQDRRGNMWATPTEMRRQTEEQASTPLFFVFLLVFSFGSIVFFAQLTGTSDSFGGAIGDGSLAVGN
mmetsp:Transcript_62378/g.202226  ORF Transcript_62378/g.202226 Transcript_62378/m.202226 type:complete len:145 (-) Transcript_62378:66-500(-)